MVINDLFGVKPLGEATKQVTQATINGVSGLLRSVCKPGFEELGYLIKDHVRQWRLNNIVKVLDKAKGCLEFDGEELRLRANPRVTLSIMRECSEVDDEELQNLWAGLFVSSCTEDGLDDSNMNFVDLIRRMSSVEARIIEYACKHCKKSIYPNGLILADDLIISFSELVKVSGINDVYRLDCELDHMRSIELLATGGFQNAGFSPDDDNLDADITPSALSLNLFHRTHSIGDTPVEFWGDSLIAVEQGESDIK